DVELRGIFVQCGLLRSLRLNQRFARLRRTGHGGEHEATWPARRNPREVGREIRRRELPRSIEALRRKPAPRDQEIPVASGFTKQRGVAVRDVLKRCSRNRN